MTHTIVICGPSGVGKTTLITRLLKEFGETLDFSVSFTTRKIRKGETAGIDYNYVSKEEFHKKEFYETCCFSDNNYGTSKDEIKRIRKKGKIPLLDVNVRSIKQLLQQKEINSSLFIIFIKPPDPMLKTLEERLRERSKETGEKEEDIKKRLASAHIELQECINLNLENIIINDDIDTAYKNLSEMVIPLIKKLQRKNDVSQNENIQAMKDVVIDNGDFDTAIDDNNDLDTIADHIHVLRVNNDDVNIKIDNNSSTENGNRHTIGAFKDDIGNADLELDTILDDVRENNVNLSNPLAPQDNDDLDVDLDNIPNGRNCIIL